jgi:glycosyltransferase involved in cell wall biosynthesis
MKFNKVIYIVKESLHIYPPCVSQILMLNELGIEVTVLFGECDEAVKKILNMENIKYISVGNYRIKNRILGKIQSYISFRINAWRHIKQNFDTKTILWFGTAASAIALAGKYKKVPYIVSVLELYDKVSFYRKNLKYILKGAKAVISCEINRARIMKSWWTLERLPYVMPNKSMVHPRELRLQALTERERFAIKEIENKKCIIYQGLISADRDLSVLAEALSEIDSEYTLVLIGKEFYNGVEKIKKIYNKTIYLGFFPAPDHLKITSYAHVGVACYDDSSLNNLFCAPNKIYEYAGFGIPVLGNNVPGLLYSIGTAGAGICADFSNKNNIIEALKDIEDNYAEYSRNATIFYENTDNFQIMKEIINNEFK